MHSKRGNLNKGSDGEIHQGRFEEENVRKYCIEYSVHLVIESTPTLY